MHPAPNFLDHIHVFLLFSLFAQDTLDDVLAVHRADLLATCDYIPKLLYFFKVEDDWEPQKTNMVLVTELNSTVNLAWLKNWLRDEAAVVDFPKELCPLILLQILRGLDYLHRWGHVHRYLRPENILINPETGVTQICDYRCLIRKHSLRKHGKFLFQILFSCYIRV